MEDITQIKVGNVTYDICDITTETSLSEISDWFICDGESSLIKPKASVSSEHSRLYTEKDTGSSCFATKHPNNEKSYIFNLWGDTGNIRLDSYDHTSGTRTILGYIPLSDHQTNKGVEVVKKTSLFTPESGWTVNSCQIVRWGQIVQVRISVKNTTAISVGASGNITNITVGTLNAAYRPADFTGCMGGDNEHHVWGYMDQAGKVSIGAFDGTGSNRSIAADTTIVMHSRYILKIDDSQL